MCTIRTAPRLASIAIGAVVAATACGAASVEPRSFETPGSGDPLMAASEELVEHCVDHVQVGAFLGDTALVEWWDDVDHDLAVLRQSCRHIVVVDPWRLERLSDEWRQVQSALSDADATGSDHVSASGSTPSR